MMDYLILEISEYDFNISRAIRVVSMAGRRRNGQRRWSGVIHFVHLSGSR